MSAVATRQANQRDEAHSSNIAQQQIRGSSLLLAGRVIALGINFLCQVLMVRYLSKSDYGMFSYALSIVTIVQGLVAFGLPDTIARYVPIYQQQREYGKMFGTILIVVASIGLLSCTLILLAWLFPASLLGLLAADQSTLTLLLILAFLIPGDALNLVLNSLFASFARPMAIFWRKSVLIPGLRLLAVVAVMLMGGNVLAFGIGLPLASIVGVVLYGWYFVHLLYREGYIARAKGTRLEWPLREVFGFALPLLSSTIVWHAIDSANVLLLGQLSTLADVATYQAVIPLARITQVVLQTFALLFMPVAAALFARNDHAGQNELYWQTAVWMTIIAFPIFAMLTAFARPMTAFVYGQRYADSALVLALVSAGYFFQTLTGFNNLTLRVHKKLGFLMITDGLAVIVQIAVSLALFPLLGVVGAAIGTTATLFLHNLLMQIGLHRLAGISLPGRDYLRIYAAVVLAAVGLATLGWWLPSGMMTGWWLPLTLLLGGWLSAAITLGLLWISRRVIRIDQLFPEVLRVPGMKLLMHMLTRS